MTLFLPIISPLVVIILLLFGRGRLKLQQYISLAGMGLLVFQAFRILVDVWEGGIQTVQAGSWPAPYGISLVADLFTGIMLLTVAVAGFCVVLYSFGMLDDTRQRSGFYVLSHALITGVNGSLLTGDIFNLYVWFEVMLLSSFVLITLGAGKKQLSGAVKYVILNLVGSVIFVTAIGLIYGQTGTLNMADIALKLRAAEPSGLTNTTLMLFFIAFGIKAALFPFYFWLPASYPAPPMAITALLAATLTKVGVYVIVRFYSLFVISDFAVWQVITLSVAGITMLSGVLMAASSFDVRKILSFHIISQIGYIIMGLGIGGALGLGAAIYFMVHNMLSKTAAFMAVGLMQRAKGSFDLKKLGGIYKSHPLLAMLFLVPALSLAGIPPTPGFFGKLFLIMAGFSAAQWTITALAIVVSIITLFSMVKIWNEAVWKKMPAENPPSSSSLLPKSSMISAAIIVLLILSMGIATAYLSDVFIEAGRSLLDPQSYIKTVLP